MATEMLRRVWTRIEGLPPAAQDALAERIERELDELEEREWEWDALVASPASQRLLDRWADEAIREDEAGLTRDAGDRWSRREPPAAFATPWPNCRRRFGDRPSRRTSTPLSKRS